MNIEDIIRKNKLKRNSYVNEKETTSSLNPKLKYFKNLITRSLITIIFVLASLIFTKMSTNNKELYEKIVLNDSLKFTKINKWYQSLFGKADILDTTKLDDTPVFNSINYTNIEPFKNGYKFAVKAGEVVNVIKSGIVVFNGNKDDLGNTIIIEGNDGVDIWYSNITDSDIKIYDYIESNAILGVSSSDYIILTIIKDGKYISYEEYMELL